MQQTNTQSIDYNILGTEYEKSLDKYVRKKDGIFYTPKYITDYIVENTIGRLCKEKQAELDLTNFKKLSNLQE